MVYALIVNFIFLAAGEIGLSQLVDHHSSSIELVNRLDVEIAVRETINEGRSVSIPMWSVRWSKQFDSQRQRYRMLHLPTQDELGNPINIGDIFEDTQYLYVLQNWDPSLSKRILDPSMPGPVRAWKQNRNGKLPVPSLNVASMFALFEIQPGPEDERRSLRELVASSPAAEYLGTITVDGLLLHKLRIIHPHTKTGQFYRDCVFNVYLDPAVGYLIRRLELAVPVDAKLNRPHADYEWIVQRFKKVAGDVYFPVETTYLVRFPDFSDKITSECTMKASKLTVNAALPSDAMNFTFPENTVVNFDGLSNDKSRQAFLWGPDNKPIKELHSAADLRPDSNAVEPSRNWIRPIIAGLFLITLFSFFVVYRSFLAK